MRLLFAFLAVLILTVAQPSQAATTEPPVLELRAGEDAPSLVPFIRFTQQTEGEATPRPDQLLEKPLESVEGPTIHFGPPGTPTLVLLKVRNAAAQQGSWILTTGRGSLTQFRLYEAVAGRFDLLVDGNDPQAARQNLGTYQAFSAELLLDSQQEKLILIEFLSENSTYMPLKINSYGTFFKERRVNIAMVSGVVVGALTLLLLNFLFFSITGFRAFLWLAVAEGFFVLSTIHAEGYFTIFFLYDKPLTAVAVEDFIKCGFAGAMAQFGRSFVRTSTFFPRRDVALKLLIFTALVVMLLQLGLAIYSPEIRFLVHLAAWLVAISVALFLPFIGFAAMRQFGFQLWPLFVGWATLAGFIVYASIGSMGIIPWLPVNWHLVGPFGLFEVFMVTLALGLNLKKIQRDKIAADANYARALSERLAITERAKQLAEEHSFALATVSSQNALIHASGHDSSQVILALNSAIDVLKRKDEPDVDGDLIDMLQSSSDYLNEIVSTTISGANIAAGHSDFVTLSSFRAQALVEPLSMMFKAPFATKKLSLKVRVDGEIMLISDRPLLMRALANLLSNSYKYTSAGGVDVALTLDDGRAVISIRDTGGGMSDDFVAALNGDTMTRIRADESIWGTGSGFGSAKRIIETLHGSLEILSSSPTGTTIRIILPAAFAAVTAISAEELQAGLGEWTVVDFDQRADFEASLTAAEARKEHFLALTYDDTTVTRGRLSELVAMVAIKPPCRELLRHPLLLNRSQQV